MPTALDLPGPSRRIRVEPLRPPAPRRDEPAREPVPAAPAREPERGAPAPAPASGRHPAARAR